MAVRAPPCAPGPGDPERRGLPPAVMARLPVTRSRRRYGRGQSPEEWTNVRPPFRAERRTAPPPDGEGMEGCQGSAAARRGAGRAAGIGDGARRLRAGRHRRLRDDLRRPYPEPILEPTIAGDLRIGGTVTCAPGTWNDGPREPVRDRAHLVAPQALRARDDRGRDVEHVHGDPGRRRLFAALRGEGDSAGRL